MKPMYRVVCCWLFALLVSVPAVSQEDGVRKAPDFELRDLDGNTVNSDRYKGKYLVIHIATTWCPFCNAEAPYLEQLYRDYRAQNVEVVIIDVKESADLVREKLQDRFNFSFPVLLDCNGKVAASFAPEDVLTDLSRDEVMLASNTLVGPEGDILFMSLLDSKDFDARLVALREVLDRSLPEH